MTLTCAQVQERLLELLYDELAAGGAAAVRAHLDGCPGCARELETLREVRAAYREGATEEDGPSPAVIAALHAAARAEVAGPAAAPSRPPSGRRWWQTHTAWGMAASLLLVATVVYVNRDQLVRNEPPATVQKQQAPSEPSPAPAPGAGDTSGASASLSSEDRDRLASLGYVGGEEKAAPRQERQMDFGNLVERSDIAEAAERDAPRPIDFADESKRSRWEEAAALEDARPRREAAKLKKVEADEEAPRRSGKATTATSPEVTEALKERPRHRDQSAMPDAGRKPEAGPAEKQAQDQGAGARLHSGTAPPVQRRVQAPPPAAGPALVDSLTRDGSAATEAEARNANEELGLADADPALTAGVPARAAVDWNAAQTSIRNQDLDTALTHLQNVQDAAPASTLANESRYVTARIHQQRGDCARALQTFDDLLRQAPAYARTDEALLAKADCLRTLGRVPEARRNYLLLLERHPRQRPVAADRLLDLPPDMETQRKLKAYGQPTVKKKKS